LKDNRDFVNEKDWHSNTPLLLAIRQRFIPAVHLLLTHGADPSIVGDGGWNALEEAVASGDPDLVLPVAIALDKKFENQFQNRVPRLLELINQLPDFYWELGWELKSWLPLVSRFCPNDTYQIWKRGTSIRIDTTLIGFQQLRWKRGRISLVIGKDLIPKDDNTKGSLVDIILLDHEQRKVEILSKDIKSSEDSEEITRNVVMELIEQKEFVHTCSDTSSVSFRVSQRWFGGEKRETIAGFETKVFEMEGFQLNITQRKRANLENSSKIQRSNSNDDLLPQSYFNRLPDPSKGK